MTKEKIESHLEEVCFVCDGGGGYWAGENDTRPWSSCNHCGGIGFMPTDEGKAIFEMIRHQLKPLARQLAASR